jgi:hypothetical protein
VSRRAETDLEREGLAVGALLSAADLEKARRIAAVLPPPGAFLDQTARAAVTLSLDLLSRGELPSAATVFTAGTASTNLFTPEDRERLRSWQIDSELTDQELVVVGRHLNLAARVRRIAATFKALGVALERGTDKEGRPFGPGEARVWFDQLARAYNTAHASGISGSDAVDLTRARHAAELAEGRSGFLKTGIGIFDNIFGGYPNKLAVLVGAGGAGKSTVLGTQLDLHQAFGIRSVLSSMEDNHEWPVIRHVALMLGLKYRETYSGPFPDEQKARDAEGFLKERWKNLTILSKRDGRTVDEHLQLWAQYIVQHGARVFYIDNLTTIDHQQRPREQKHDAAARTVEKLAEFADLWRVTVIALAHTKNDWFVQTKGQECPTLNDVADTGGGIASERYARLAFGIWSTREGELRLTCIKNMAEGKLAIERKTLAFDVHIDQGLLDPDSGREVNLAQEQRLKAEATEATKKARRQSTFEENKKRQEAYQAEQAKKKEAAAAAARAKEPLQHELLAAQNPKERA